MEMGMNEEKMNQQEPKQQEEDDSKTKRRRLVMVPGSYQGHVNPLFHLVTILHSRGFSMTIAHTTFNFPEPWNHPEFTFLPLAGDSPEETSFSDDFVAAIFHVNNNCESHLTEIVVQTYEPWNHPEFTFLPVAGDSPEETSFSDDFVAAIFHVNNNCESHLTEIVVQTYDLVCVIFDELMYFADFVAESLNVLRIMLRTASVATLNARLIAVKFKEEGQVPVPGIYIYSLYSNRSIAYKYYVVYHISTADYDLLLPSSEQFL